MAKVKSPLKNLRIYLDLSKSELASLVFPGRDRDNSADKAELAQAIGLCEAGLRDPSNFEFKHLFILLSDRGYKTLKEEQIVWFNARLSNAQ